MYLPRRKPMRLNGYDYKSNGYYFVTICTHERKNILSRVVVGQGLAPAATELTQYGKIMERQLLALEDRYAHIKIDRYVIMPNHIHAIIALGNEAAGASPCPTSLSDVICSFKSLATRECRALSPEKIFQNSFYDHIIRGREDYLEICWYIENNPARWAQDRFYRSENL